MKATEENFSASDRWQKQAKMLLKKYLGPHWVRLIVLGLFVVVGSGLELLGPQILQWAIDSVNSGTTVDSLRNLGLLYIFAMLALRTVQGATTYIASNLSWSATNSLRSDLAQRVLGLPLQFHFEFTPGQLGERIDGDVGALGDLFSRFLLKLFVNIVFLIGAVGVLFGKDARLGLAFLVSVLCTVIAYRKLSNIAVSASRAERQAQSELMNTMEEGLRGAEDARPLGATHYLMEKFFSAARRHIVTSRRSMPLGTVPFAVTMAIMGINEAVCLSWA
ncbi:MAG: ABC transporter ATP-binding protein [Proteobacteria bacterium]|nr:ABC transporter ATP-binding protein [Pseudomonadota bacterium]